ncbi:MAG: efflux transporter outer membrane subunit [Chlamydiia bacterium]|nr:efflux transporter outer membrane subunit [Chlamydiia bacterium]
MVSFLFESCAALKKRNYEPQVMESADVSLSIDSALQTPDFSAGEWPAYNWWSLFEDEQLSELMEIAIEKNPDLLAAVSRVRVSQEEAKKVRSSLLPKLDADFRDNYEHLSKDSLDRFPPSTVPAVVNQLYLALNFEYEIDLFGKNRNRYRAAIGQTRAQAAEMSASLLMITTLLAETYIQYAAHLQNLQYAQALADAQKMQLELTELRFVNGLGDQMLIDQATAAYLDAQETVVFYKKEIALDVSQLKILMGLGPDDPREISSPQLAFDRSFPLPENIPLNLLSRRPDLMAQIWTVEAAAHLISAAKAAFFPNINLAAFVGLESLKWNNFFSVNSYAGALTPAINLPLFTGGKLTAQLNKQYATYDAAVYDYNALLLRAAKEVTDQINILEAANQESRLQTQAYEKTMHIAELTTKRYENGLDNYLMVLEKQMDTLKQGMKEVDTENQRYLAILQLIKALGGGYHGG